MEEKPPTFQNHVINRYLFGDGSTPEVSVCVSHARRRDDWWKLLYDSVAAQVGVKSWELIEVQDFEKTMTIGEAKNVAAFQSNAPYVFFLDDDDFLKPKCLRDLLKVAKEENSDMVNVFSAFCDADNRSFEGFFYGPGLIKTETFKSSPMLRVSYFEDVELIKRYMQEGRVVSLLKRVLFYYRLHSGQTTWVHDSNRKGMWASLAKERGYRIE